MARKKIFTDKIQDIASYDEIRRANASSLPNNLSKQGVNNSVTYNARRNNYINASANKQSNLKSEKELLHEKFYGKDGRVEGFYNLKTDKIFGDQNIIIELSAAPIPPAIMSYNYNIDFDLTNVTITSFDPEGNENDRPRINTFREDGEFIIYLSAGGSYRYSNGTISLPPWGDRTTGSFSTSITSIDGIAGTTPEALSAGIDVFAGDTMTVYLTPLSTNWFITDTNPGEKKYQLLHNTGGDYDIGIKIIPPCIFILEPTFFGMASVTPKVGPTAGGPTLTGENIFNIYQAIGTGSGYANNPRLSGGITFETIPCIKSLFIRVVGGADTYGLGFDTLTINVDGVQKEFFQSVDIDPFTYPLDKTIRYDEIINLSTHINDDNSHVITLSGISGTIANNNVGYDVKISHSVIINDTSVETFSLSSNKTSVNEGNTFTILLSSVGVTNGTNVPYTITGIDAGDISESLTGNFTVNNNIATNTFNVVNDLTTEGSDTFTLTLDGKATSTSVTINDTSVETYLLSSNKTSVNEGESFAIALSTQGISDSTSIPYTITGIDAGDISESLIGNFIISSNLATATFNVSADNITEGSDTFTITLDNGEASKSVTINDTSVETFSLSSNKTSVNEGDSFTILLSSIGVTDGTLVPYTITGVTSADITDRGGSITVTGASDSTHNATYTYYAKHDNWRNLPADAATNQRYDYFAIDPDGRWRFKYNDSLSSIFSVNSNVSILDADWSGTFIATEGWSITTSSDYSDITSLTGNFTVNNSTDTKSFTAVEDDVNEGTQTFTLTLDGKATSTSVNINDTSAQTYSLSAPTSVNESFAFQVALSTTGVPEGTSIPYTITGDVSSSDYSAGQSVFVVKGDGTADIGFATLLDFTTEGAETFTLTLDNGEANVDVIINDTSVETFSLSSNKTSVNEGESFEIALNTQGVVDGTFVTYSVIGIQDSDLSSGSRFGVFTINNNTDVLSFTVANDFTTETTETFNLGLDGKFKSIDVDIIDTSTATYTLSGNKTSVNEGDTFTIQLSTQGISDGVSVPYTITGIQNGDISQSLDGNFIVSNSIALSTFNVVNDLTTEGTETFTLTLDGRSVSFNVTINDTSQTISQSDDRSSFIYINDSFKDMFN
jgi:hypothetical protein